MSTTNRREVPPDGNSPDFAADATAFGEFLRTRRQNKGISLDQITNETKIPQRHFDALENGSVRSWPRGMYTRAMLRAYAESVGLDKEYVAHEFDRVFTPQNATPPAAPAPVASPTVSAPRLRLWRRQNWPVHVWLRRGRSLRLRLWQGRPQLQRRPVAIAGGLAICVAVVTFIAVFAFRSDNAPLAVADPTAGPVRTADIPLNAAPTTANVVNVAPTTASVVNAARTEPASASPVVRAAAAPTERTPAAPRAVDGELIITSEPAGARVIVDGVGRGSTPARIKYLPFGAKRVRLTKDGYVSAERTVSLSSKTPFVTVEMKLAPRQ